jgi:hypothetical protein
MIATVRIRCHVSIPDASLLLVQVNRPTNSATKYYRALGKKGSDFQSQQFDSSSHLAPPITDAGWCVTRGRLSIGSARLFRLDFVFSLSPVTRHSSLGTALRVCHAGVRPSALPAFPPSDFAAALSSRVRSLSFRAKNLALLAGHRSKNLALPALAPWVFAYSSHSSLVTSIFNNSFFFINIVERMVYLVCFHQYRGEAKS